MRDGDLTKSAVQINPESIGEWEEICIGLDEINNEEFDLGRIDNIELFFDQTTGRAVIWVDDFEFR